MRNSIAIGLTIFLLLFAGFHQALALVIGPGGGGGTTQTLTTQPLSNFDVSGTPVRLAVDAQGKLYISDPLRHAVLVYSNNGLFLSTIQGIEKPLGIAVDGSGTLYVGDAETGSVLIYDGSGHYVTRLGSGEGEFVYPNDIAISSSGNIFVADSAAHVVKAYSSAGSFSFGDTVLLYPTGIVVDDIAGEVYVSDDPSKSIIVFDLNGLYRRTIRLGSSFSPTVLRPQGLSVDAQNIYIADAYNSAIAAYTKSGTFIKFIGNYGSNLGEMRVPLDAALDRDGKLFVANYNNERIEEIGIGTTFTDISVSPAMVQFTVHECTALPSQTVNVSSGASAVAWTAYATVPWITLSAQSGTTPSTVMITAGSPAMPNGIYTGYVNFVSPNGIETVVKVQFTIDVQVSFSVSPSSVSMLYQMSSSALPEATLVLASSGCGVHWDASTSAGWLQIDPLSGDTPSNAQVSGTEALRNLDAGTYHGAVSINAGTAAGSPASVTVTLEVIRAGTVMVTTNLAEATFTVSGPQNYDGAGQSWSSDRIDPGEYTIEFHHVSGYSKPLPQNFTVGSGQTVHIEATYREKRRSSELVAVSGDKNPGTANIVSLDGTTNKTITVFDSNKTMHAALGDVDGDGIDEIAFSDNTSHIEIYRADNSVVQSLSMSPAPVLSIAMGDMDNDGKADLLIGTVRDGKRIVTYSGFDAQGAWKEKGVLLEIGISTDQTNYPGLVIGAILRALRGSWSGEDFTLASGDTDGDGRADLIIADKREIAVYRIVGEVNAGISWKTGNPFEGVPSLAAGDINDDGVSEVVVGAGSSQNNSPTAKVYKGDGSTVLFEINAFADLGYAYGVSVAAGDIDGDFRDEIIVGAGPSPDNRSLVRIFEEDGSFTGTTIDALNRDAYGARVGVGKLMGGMQ